MERRLSTLTYSEYSELYRVCIIIRNENVIQ